MVDAFDFAASIINVLIRYLLLRVIYLLIAGQFLMLMCLQTILRLEPFVVYRKYIFEQHLVLHRMCLQP